MRKDRGLIQLDSYLENFSSDIEKKIKQKGKVKILDAGCGYGLAMAGLIKQFGNKIEIVGYNQKKEHGTIKDFKERSVKTGIFTKEEIKKLKNPPKIIYIDADKGLPFKDNSFDFVFSLASVYLYKDKIKFFEECNRVLKKEGVARISLFETKFFEDRTIVFENLRKLRFPLFLEIWASEREINFMDYFESIKNVEIKFGKREDKENATIYIEIRKSSKLNFKLNIIGFVDMGIIAPDRYGIRSIYMVDEEKK